MLSGNRTSAVDRALVLLQDLAQGFALASDLVTELQSAHTMSRVRELDLAFVLAQVGDVSRHLDLDQLETQASLLCGGRDGRSGDLRRELARIRAVLEDPDLDHAGAHAIDRSQARALEPRLSRDLDRVQALLRCSELARTRAAAWARDGSVSIDLDLSQALKLLAERNHRDLPKSEWTRLSRSVRQFVRFEVLAQVIELDALYTMPPDVWTRELADEQKHTETERQREAHRKVALDVYVQLGILEDRIEGHLPAWEGIRIVAERVQ
jgi:hypothetical protein